MGPSGYECPLGVMMQTSESTVSNGILTVMMTSPFYVLFHLAETSVPYMGGGDLRASFPKDCSLCLAMLQNILK